MDAPRQLQACIVPSTVLYSPSWFTALATERRAGMAAGGGAEENRLCPPPSAGAVRWAPNATGAALAPHPAFAGAGKAVAVWQSHPLVLRGGRAMRGLLLCGGWLLAAGCLVGASGSCRHRCCPGRNNACWVPGPRRAHCYCDSYCQRTDDCCQDYHSVCRRAGECRRGWH